MLVVTFVYDEHGFPIMVEAQGHADWAVLGRDVVCAAASTVLQSTWFGLSEVAGVAVEGVKESGYLRMEWPESDRRSEAVRVLITTADLSILQLATQYPKNLRHERRDGYSSSYAFTQKDQG